MTAPAGPLFRLIYRSRQIPSVAADLDHEVRRIIASAIPHNRDDGLTGLLITVQGHFIQALEGQADAVRNTFARISRDPRHDDAHIISQAPVPDRLFSDWNMCARALAASDHAILDVIDVKGPFNPAALTAPSVLRLLTTVADIQRRKAGSAAKGQTARRPS